MSDARPSAVIILAAGEGTRMRSALPKVMHPIGGRSLVGHAIAAARATGTEHVAVVVRHDRIARPDQGAGADHRDVHAAEGRLHGAPGRDRARPDREAHLLDHAELVVQARGVDPTVALEGLVGRHPELLAQRPLHQAGAVALFSIAVWTRFSLRA